MDVVAKMTVTNITGTGGKMVHLLPRHDETIPEDQRFFKATPWGDCNMAIDNPTVLAQFNVGDVFYLTFRKVAS